jgi:hypothetical protein
LNKNSIETISIRLNKVKDRILGLEDRIAIIEKNQIKIKTKE